MRLNRINQTRETSGLLRNFRGPANYSPGLLVAILLLLMAIRGNAQTSTVGNTAGDPAYLGWANGNAFPLIVQHQGAQPINFLHDNNLTMNIGALGGVGIYTPADALTQLNVFSDTPNAVLVSYGGQVIQDQADLVEGARFISEAGSTQDIGLIASSTGELQTIENIGAFGQALNANLSIGILAQICVPDTSGNSNSAAFFNGNVRITGILDGPSDANLKYDVQDLTDEHLDLLQTIVAKSYYFIQDHERLNLPPEKQFGFIAQEVQEVFPNLTHRVLVPEKYDDDGEVLVDSSSYLTVDYLKFIPLSVQWYQEQDQTIEENKTRLEDLENRMAVLLQQASDAKNSQQQIESSQSSKGFKLYPNPTENQLNLVLPEGIKGEYLVRIIDMSGRLILEHRLALSQSSAIVPLDISSLPKGMYEVELSGKTYSETLKFLKK